MAGAGYSGRLTLAVEHSDILLQIIHIFPEQVDVFHDSREANRVAKFFGGQTHLREVFRESTSGMELRECLESEQALPDERRQGSPSYVSR